MIDLACHKLREQVATLNAHQTSKVCINKFVFKCQLKVITDGAKAASSRSSCTKSSIAIANCCESCEVHNQLLHQC